MDYKKELNPKIQIGILLGSLLAMLILSFVLVDFQTGAMNFGAAIILYPAWLIWLILAIYFVTKAKNVK